MQRRGRGMPEEVNTVDMKNADMSARNRAEKTRTSFAKIIVEGTAEKPYYSILYYAPADGEYHIGYSSYSIEIVFQYLSECFEVADDNSALEKAIGILKKKYERAKQLDFVRDPLAYALYHTWKKVDERKR